MFRSQPLEHARCAVAINVATIHDFDTQQGVDFQVMEYIPGITLSKKVAAGPLPEKAAMASS